MHKIKGYRAVKRAVITALATGDYLHQACGAIDVKNLLATGEVSAADVIAIIERSDGTCYACSSLHGSSEVDGHLIRSAGWYVKFDFADPTTVFISVHR